MVRIREVVQKAILSGYLDIEAEAQLRHLLSTKYEIEDLNAFMKLQLAAMNGDVLQESRELLQTKLMVGRVVSRDLDLSCST